MPRPEPISSQPRSPRSSAEPWVFEAIGTRWEVESDRPIDDDVRAQVLLAVEEVDRTWSRFRADSVVSRAGVEGGAWTLDDTADRLLRFYDDLHAVSDAAVTPLVGRTLADLGYDAGYSLQRADDVAEVPDWDLVRWEPPVLTLAEPVLLDVGAAGKGFLVDRVSDVLLAAGHPHVTVDASGDLMHRGEWPLRVALQDPRDHARAIGIVEIGSGWALAASGVDRRSWGTDLHHVLDGRTGEPTREVVATWAVARDAMTADGLATALFLVDPERLAERWDLRWVVMHADGSARWSRDLAVEVFT